MNNEPVAWMSNDSFEISTMQSDKFSIPLYTHPAKELTLTDDEIDDVWAACSTGESDTIDMHLFAEAILRKAQESCNGFCGEYECKENKAGCKRKAQEK